jgi:hypothetical protein
MRRNVEVFINNQRVDLFDFEDINIVDSVQDVRDVAKIFVPYSREFTIPASKNNNKIFRHYYNNDIVDGFDARFKISAVIKVNGMVYKTGRVTLLNSSLKNNRPVNYKLVFYSKTIDFKTLLKDDLLEDMDTSVLSKFNIEYNAQNVFDGFNYGYNLVGDNIIMTSLPVENSDLIIPFISTNSHYYYDDVVTNVSPLEGDSESRNVNFNGGVAYPNDVVSGVNWKDLRPSLKLPILMQAIEEKYTISFVSDFFNTDAFNKLYIWLNNDKGLYGEERTVGTDFSEFTLDNGNDERPITTTSSVFYRLLLTVDIDDVNDDYELNVTNNNDSKTIYTSTAKGSNTFEIPLLFRGGGVYVYDLNFEITGVESNSITLGAKLELFSNGLQSTSNYSFVDAATDGVFNIRKNMPKIKVIDFLTSLFKMFNLTAYVNDDDNIVVDTLDDYYRKGSTVDITRFTKNEESTVSRNKLYSQIDFMFEEPKTFATINSNELSRDEFGNERMSNTIDDDDLRELLAFDGGEYEVAPKFEKMQYERMTDQSNPTLLQNFCWGWCVTDDQKATLTKPILHYAENVDVDVIPLTVQMGFDQTTGQENIPVSYYFRPANSLNTNLLLGQSLHFGSEDDEYYTSLGSNENSLFNIYWKNTILAIYDEKSRITTYKANLPISIANTIRLNDVVIVNRKKYRINKIDINITTGDASLELVTYRKLVRYNGFTVDSDAYTVDSTLITVDKTI